jgi:hypothetical protein
MRPGRLSFFTYSEDIRNCAMSTGPRDVATSPTSRLLSISELPRVQLKTDMPTLLDNLTLRTLSEKKVRVVKCEMRSGFALVMCALITLFTATCQSKVSGHLDIYTEATGASTKTTCVHLGNKDSSAIYGGNAEGMS